MLGGPIDETVEILHGLKQKNRLKIIRAYQLEHETFPACAGTFLIFLHWF